MNTQAVTHGSEGIEDLRARGLVNISYPQDLRMEVEASTLSWRMFCGLPLEQKSRFIYQDGTGYEYKNEKGAHKDQKEDFHVTLGDLPRLETIAEEIGRPEAMRFIHNAGVLISHIEPIVKSFSELAEDRFSAPGLSDEVMASLPYWTVRFLHYFGDRAEGEITAQPHPDKGLTLHLYESHPGLEYMDWEHSWKPMPVSEGQTVIIGGMQFQLRTNGAVRALYHRVRALGEAAVHGRYSSVCFLPLVRTEAYDKKGNGRLQEFPIGFNYKMEFDEFKKLFVPRR